MSNKPFRILQEATIKAIYKGDCYVVSLDENPTQIVYAKPSGKMRKRSITLTVGDAVVVELSPYDLHKGRIRWRHK